MNITYSKRITSLTYEEFVQWFPWDKSLVDEEFKKLHNDDTGVLPKVKKQKPARAKKRSSKKS